MSKFDKLVSYMELLESLKMIQDNTINEFNHRNQECYKIFNNFQLKVFLYWFDNYSTAKNIKTDADKVKFIALKTNLPTLFGDKYRKELSDKEVLNLKNNEEEYEKHLKPLINNIIINK